MKRAFLFIASAFVLASCGTTLTEAGWRNDPALQGVTAGKLEQFSGEREFVDYIRQLRTIARARGEWWAGAPVQYASLDQPPLPCDPTVQECPKEKEVVVVTANKRESSVSDAAVAVEAVSDTITNVQKSGVDEGDIVKRIGKHLVVLQDGRLFSVDMETLKLSDRKNIYTKTNDDSWYDEILVTGRRVLVTGYSYRENATQFSVFAMDEAGRFTAEGTFFLSSNDYYDVSNYASRLVGNKLVIYSPMDLTEINPDKPVEYPVVRRWSMAPASQAPAGTRLFDAHDIYKPLQQALEPTVHTISVCDLGAEAMSRNLDCRTTAFVAPASHTVYVSPDDVFVWVADEQASYDSDPSCLRTASLDFNDGPPSSVFRIPLSGVSPTAMRARGVPQDQFAMDTSRGEFRALVFWGRTRCDENDWESGKMQVRYFSAPLSMFSEQIRTAPRSRYIETPAPEGARYENRFTDRYVVYASRDSYWAESPEIEEPLRRSQIVAVPVKHADEPVIIRVPHDANRLERIGSDIIVTGYRDWKGLSVSTVDLDGRPKLADTLALKGRYESEGRSHAFNARLDGRGDGLMGLPTVTVPEDSYRKWWRSDESDVSFMAFDRDGHLEEAGVLTPSKKPVDPSYRCEVSCIDWYGNSRPIFIGERIFALTATEIVEGRLSEGKVIEVRRLNLTASPPSSASDS